MERLQSRIPRFAGLASRSCIVCRRRLTPVPPLTLRSPGRTLTAAPVAAQVSRKERVQEKHKSLRRKIEGTPERPRLAVYRSNHHIYAQVIDDKVGNTLAAASTLTPAIRSELKSKFGADKDAAELVGKLIAELCLKKNIAKVSFDRGGRPYHGRVQALAQSARDAGLTF